MKAIQLFHKDGRSASVWYCEKCLCVAATESVAESCCRPYKCRECGEETENRMLRCNSCRSKLDAAREMEKFAKSAKVTAWDGWIFVEGLGYRDGFFESVGDLHDFCGDDEIAIPQYAWTCTPTQFAFIDFSEIEQGICENNAYEDFDPGDLNGVDEIKKAIDAFNESNKELVSYSPDYSKSVLLSQWSKQAEVTPPLPH